jgi:hypothetical protein
MVKIKSGEEITLKEWFKRAKQGIKNVATNPTPIERITQESYGTFTSLIGYITCLVVMIIFNDKFFINWFAYGLILVFIGTIWTTGLKWFGLRQQLKLFKNMDKQCGNVMEKLDSAFEDIEEKIEEKKEENNIAKSQVAVNLVAKNLELLEYKNE